MRNSVLIFLLALSGTMLHGQRTMFFSNPDRFYQEGWAEYDAMVHSRAFLSFSEQIEPDLWAYQPNDHLVNTHAEFARAKAAMHLQKPGADQLAVAFIEKHRPDPVAVDAMMDVANFYFSSRKYGQAREFYALLESENVPSEVLAEATFKEGYCYFAEKEYQNAETRFSKIKNGSGKFADAASYYYGMCRYFEGDLESAVASFKKVADKDPYNKYLPYYTIMLYFANGDYQSVVDYGKTVLVSSEGSNSNEIRHRVGQAYFEMGDYDKALPYLEEFSAGNQRMTESEFYQLAYAQYITGRCSEATETFKNIANARNPFGQRANFYIGVCNMRMGDYREARNAFRAVSRMEFDPQLQEEALFNFGKLSAQLKYDSEAIQALYSIDSGSPHYSEAQQIIRDVFNNTRDYSSSLALIESIDSPSPSLKESYQRLALELGLQHMRDGEMSEAAEAFKKVETYPIDPAVSAQALFWRSEIAHSTKDYDQSRSLINKFFTTARSAGDLPLIYSGAFAHYTQGYNYLAERSYGMALDHFNNAITGFKSTPELHQLNNSPYIFSDAMARSADCLFKLGRYAEADSMYLSVIENDKYETVYAQYQHALIVGLSGQKLDKIILLEQIADDHANSQYADDALFEAAITNQELGNSDRALKLYSRLDSDYPNSPYISESLLRRGLVSYNNGDVASAINYYEAVFDSRPTPTEAQEAMAALEEIFVRDLAQPERYFAFIESVPGFELDNIRKDSISFRAAELLYEHGEYEKAIAEFEEYERVFPNGLYLAQSYYFKGESHGILKAFPKALGAYDKVVAMGPGEYYMKSLKKAASLSYHSAEDYDRAFKYYNTLTEEMTDSLELYEAHLGRVRSAYRMQNTGAVKTSAEYLLTVPDIPEDVLGETHFYVAKAHMAVDDLDNALIHFNKVTRLSDNVYTAESRHLIAWIYYSRQQYELAERICHNAISANGNYPEWVARGLILLSDIYIGKDDLFNARAPLEAVIENFEGNADIVRSAQTKLAELEDLQNANSRIKADSDSVIIED